MSAHTVRLDNAQETDAQVIATKQGNTVDDMLQRLADGEKANWAEIARRIAKDLRLAKLEAAPKELRDQIDAVKLTAEAGVPIT